MSENPSPILPYQPKRPPDPAMDDWAYLAPMGIFLALTFVGGHWPTLFVASYAAKTLLAAAALIYFRRHYTQIRWNAWGWGIVVGVLGIVQWVGMEKLLLHVWPHYPRPSAEIFDPQQHFQVAWQLWSFAIIRWAGASLVVPFMEELFWRDYLWRRLIAPNDFKLAAVGEWDPKAFFIVALAFSSVHIQWITAIVWGLMIGLLLVRTKSLGACIIAHGVTNFLLGAYVQYTHDWYFW